jgi:N-acetylmuramoyl-L-alanine amidase
MNYTRLLKIGSRGEDVKAVQRALHCYPDGIFGELTEEAVRQWQADNKLVTDGIVGIDTWQSLFGALNADELQLHRSRRKITYIVVHSTATPEGKDYTVADIRKMHKANGWSDIGYHYVIYRDGTLHEGRDVNISGGHARGYNSNSIGIVYIGGTSATEKDKQGHLKAKDTRTHEQKATLLRLLKDLRKLYPNAKIVGHRDLNATACPSFDAKSEYKDI